MFRRAFLLPLITYLILIFPYNFELKGYLDLFSPPVWRHCQCKNRSMSTVSGAASQWLQSRFTSLYESAPPVEVSDFNALFLYTFSENAEILLNHEKVSLETFQEGLSNANFAISQASVDWKELMEVPPKEEAADLEGAIVAGFFVVTRSMKFRIRAGPAQRLSYNTFSAKITQDKDAPPDADGSFSRITQLIITSLEKATPIHIQAIPDAGPEIKSINPALLQKKTE